MIQNPILLQAAGDKYEICCPYFFKVVWDSEYTLDINPKSTTFLIEMFSTFLPWKMF